MEGRWRVEGERRWDGRARADAEARATEHPFSCGILSWGVQARALLAGPAPRRPTAEADCSPEQAGGPLERPELGWSGGGGTAVASPARLGVLRCSSRSSMAPWLPQR